jgi:WD40 repeat protein
MAFTHNGHILAVGYYDGTFRLWNVTNPRDLVPLGKETSGITAGGNTVTTNPVQAVAIGPDPHVLAVGYTNGTVRLWNITNPRRPVPLARLSGGTSQVDWAEFSPDGHVLADADEDGAIQEWNVSHPAHPVLSGQFLEASGSPTVAEFGPGGRWLAAGDSAGILRLWRPSVSSAIDWICATTANTLTRQVWQRYISLPYNPPCPHTGRAG